MIDRKLLSPNFLARLQDDGQESLPWLGHKLGEDHWVAEEAMRKIYTRLNLKEPRFAWAPSPRAMFEAINLLRSMRGQREKVINAIVPIGDDKRLAAAHQTVLEAIVDRDLLVNVGAPLKGMLKWREGQVPLCVSDLSSRFSKQTFQSQGGIHGEGKAGTGGAFAMLVPTSDVTIYPALQVQLPAAAGGIQSQVLCMAPYVKVCWFSRPPVSTDLYEDGHLKRMMFADGFTIDVPMVEHWMQFTSCVDEKHEECSRRQVIADGIKYIFAMCNCSCHGNAPELPQPEVKVLSENCVDGK